MKLHPIQGDPRIADRKHHIALDWYDRVTDDQLMPYKDRSEINQHMNADSGWEEHLELIEGTGLTVRWWEYRAASCKAAPPLVACFYEYYNTSWQRVADREGLVLAAFEYHRNQRRPPRGIGSLGYGPGDEEIEAYHIVIERVAERYGCDRGRVYLNGLSYGDMSTLLYAQRYGESLAGAVLVNGPSCPYNIERYGFMERMPALPSMQIRSDDDMTCDGFPAGLAFELEGNEEWLRNIRSRQVICNRNIWLRANGADRKRPRLYSEGKRVFARYPGAGGDVIFAEYSRKSHIIPIDNAEVMWSLLFSRYRRGAGGIECIDAAFPEDRGAVALSVGCAFALVNNEVRALSAPCLILDPAENPPRDSRLYCNTECSYSSFYAPVDILKVGFGLDYSVEPLPSRSRYAYGRAPERVELRDGVLRFRRGGDDYELYANTCVVVKNGKILDLERPPLTIDGTLMLPVCELAALFGLFAGERNESVYIAAHPVELGHTIARLLREEILGDTPERPRYGVTVHRTEHGGCAVSSLAPLEGETLTVTLTPEPGCRVSRVTAAMNGVTVPVSEAGENLYWVCNVLGDVDIEAEFVK